MKIFDKLTLCIPPVVLIILIGLVELLSFYSSRYGYTFNNIVSLLEKLIIICVPYNFFVKSLLPGYIINIFQNKTLYIKHPIITKHAKMWNKIYIIYYDNYINILLQIIMLGYIIINRYTFSFSYAIYTHSWILLFPLISTTYIIISCVLYFYYISLINIYNIQCYIEYNKSVIEMLLTELSNINNEEKILTIKELLIETNHENNKLNKDYNQQIFSINSTLKKNVIVSIFLIYFFNKNIIKLYLIHKLIFNT